MLSCGEWLKKNFFKEEYYVLCNYNQLLKQDQAKSKDQVNEVIKQIKLNRENVQALALYINNYLDDINRGKQVSFVKPADTFRDINFRINILNENEINYPSTIKEKLFKKFFIEDYTQIIKFRNIRLVNHNRTQYEIAKVLEDEHFDVLMRQEETINKCFSEIPDLLEMTQKEGRKLIKVVPNKEGTYLVVTEWICEGMIWTLLYGGGYIIGNIPRIMATIVRDYGSYDNSNDRYVHIDDIQMSDNDLGHGSIAMEQFIKQVKKIGIKKITGELSSVDKDHFDRLEHFYKKFGFTVRFNNDRTSGSIKLIL